MAKYVLRSRAIDLRRKGMSYSQIKKYLRVSKSSLSLWLRDLPLSDSRIRELRDHNQERIEHYRNTMARKRRDRRIVVYKKMRKEIGGLSKREFFIAGLFLYWAEGTKADPYTVTFTNTDPAMAVCFLHWLTKLGINKDRIKIYLHLYSDMNVRKEIDFWSQRLGISLSAFRKPYIKKSVFLKRKNYKGRFGHGTCNIYVHSRDLRERIAAGIAHIRKEYELIDFDPISAI